MYLLKLCNVFVDANNDSSQLENEPFGGLKHHFLFIYRKNTSPNAIKAKAAPRNVVISIGTARKKRNKKFDKIFKMYVLFLAESQGT